jgi:3-oxoacyl-[acyl-carrier-protein] synthase II
MAGAVPSDVCVTGMAWSTPLGDSLEGVWERLLQGETGLRQTRSPHPVRNQLAGVVTDPPLDRPAADRQRVLATRTLRAAAGSAGLDLGDPAVRLVLGTSYGAHLDEPGGSLEEWAAASATATGHRQHPISVSTACSAGSDALLAGLALVQAGAASACVAGGVDVVTPAKRIGHSALGTMSPGPLRAFDAQHDGMVPGEGAAFCVLETAASARRRGAHVHAVFRGAGSANDAAGLTAPDPSGRSITLAVRRCLAAAARAETDVAVVQAHGTGTQLNDEAERTGLMSLFGSVRHPPVVFATKGALGHSLGATGAIEAVALILALRDGKVPPIHGLEQPLPGFSLPLAMRSPRAFAGRAGISLTLGFGGFNTCLLFERAGDLG